MQRPTRRRRSGLLAVTAAIASVVILLSASPASAQTTGATLKETVSDEQKAVLPGTTILITNADTWTKRTAVTGLEVWTRAPALSPGTNIPEVEMSGFASVVRTGLVLTIGQEATVNVTLTLASVTETVTVTGDAPLVETSRTGIGTTVTPKQFDSLPLAGRNVGNLATLAPGVTAVGGGGVNAAGQLSRNTTYIIDGTRHDDNAVAGTRGAFSLEAVREFQVMANQCPAQYGQASGAIVSGVTRSGTNHLAGRAFLFHRDDAFDAQDTFSKALGSGMAPFSQQQDGAFVGGPLIWDRLHDFASYERSRRRQTPVITSPLVAVDQRDFPPETDGHQPFVKADWRARSNHSISVRDRRDASETIGNNIGGLNTYERGQDTPSRFQDLVASYTVVLSARALNECRHRVATGFFDYRKDYVSNDTPDIRRPSGYFGKPCNAGGYVDEDRYQFVNSSSCSIWRHDLKAGIDVTVIRGIDFFPRNLAGTFTFTTDRPFDPNDLATHPSLCTASTADPATIDNNETYGDFRQDTWRLHQNLTLNIGVRYETDTAVSHATSYPSGIQEYARKDARQVGDDRNFAPRIGFVWDPRGDGRTAIRSGVGYYCDQAFMTLTGSIQYSLRAEDLTITNPGYPDPYSGGSVGASLPCTRTLDPEFKTPCVRTINEGAKHEVGAGLALSADVVNGRGYNQCAQRDINVTGPNVPRADPEPLRIGQPESRGHRWFTALSLGLERLASSIRFPSFGVSYTLSRAERDVEGFQFTAQDQLNPGAESLAVNHRQHQIVASATWQLPDNLQLGIVAQDRSDRPWNITTGRDSYGDTSTTDRPDLVNPNGAARDKATYSTDFTSRVGDLPRNFGIGPGYFTLDAQISKIVRLVAKRIEAFAEGFNLTNRVNYGGPIGNLGSSLFGWRTGLAGDPRQVEMGICFGFQDRTQRPAARRRS